MEENLFSVTKAMLQLGSLLQLKKIYIYTHVCVHAAVLVYEHKTHETCILKKLPPIIGIIRFNAKLHQHIQPHNWEPQCVTLLNMHN
jgi:hypothetical protein